MNDNNEYKYIPPTDKDPFSFYLIPAPYRRALIQHGDSARWKNDRRELQRLKQLAEHKENEELKPTIVVEEQLSSEITSPIPIGWSQSMPNAVSSEKPIKEDSPVSGFSPFEMVEQAQPSSVANRICPTQ